MGNPKGPPLALRRPLHEARLHKAPAGQGAHSMKYSPFAPGVGLNPAAVWELPDQLGISRNEPSRRCGFSPGHIQDAPPEIAATHSLGIL